MGVLNINELVGKLTPLIMVNDVVQPIIMSINNHPSKWIAVYSTKEKLDVELERMGVQGYGVATINDEEDFADSVFERGYRIMLDPYIINENGQDKTKFKEIFYVERETP